MKSLEENKTNKLSRRQCLKSMAFASGIFTILPRHVFGGAGYVAPSDRLNIAFIGTGGQGMINMKNLLWENDVRIIAICDVSEEAGYSNFYYAGYGIYKAGRGPAKKFLESHYAEDKSYKLRTYIDFRKMLDKEKDIDAVVVSVPHHVTAAAAMSVINRGRHLYCEKPLGHSVYEARIITETAREAGIATQMGNHGHSSEYFRLACEWIWDGAIGQIRQVHAWGKELIRTKNKTRPRGWRERRPVPVGLNWDLWLGPAKYRPYHPCYHPYHWRDWWDFGTGCIGDLGCHHLDPAFKALKLGHPASVEAQTDFNNPETLPFSSIIKYEFPARGNMPPVTLTWYDGNKPPRPAELEAIREMGDDGILYIGDKGKIKGGGHSESPRIIPESAMQAYKCPLKTIKRVPGHHRDWLNACKGGEPASSNFDYGGPLTEMVLLGNVAQRTGEKIEWDGKYMRVTNIPEANQYVQSYNRQGWDLKNI